MRGQDNQYIVEIPITGNDETATTYMGAGYFHSSVLPLGFEWEVTAFALTANTDVAHTTNAYTYSLCNSSGNTISSVATSNIDVDPSTAAGTITSTYAKIDTSSAADYIYVTGAISGAGAAAQGLKAIVTLKAHRAAS